MMMRTVMGQHRAQLLSRHFSPHQQAMLNRSGTSFSRTDTWSLWRISEESCDQQRLGLLKVEMGLGMSMKTKLLECVREKTGKARRERKTNKRHVGHWIVKFSPWMCTSGARTHNESDIWWNARMLRTAEASQIGTLGETFYWRVPKVLALKGPWEWAWRTACRVHNVLASTSHRDSKWRAVATATEENKQLWEEAVFSCSLAGSTAHKWTLNNMVSCGFYQQYCSVNS